MKQILAIVFLMSLFACSQKNSNEVTLKGHLINFDESSLRLYIDDRVDTVAVDKDGRFETTLQLDKQSSAYLMSKNFSRSFLLLPGFELSFTQDVTNKEDGFKFTNQNVLVATNLYQEAMYKLHVKLTPNKREFLALDEEAFIAKANDIYTQKKNLLDAFAKANDYADSDFVRLEMNKIKYEKLNSFISFKSSHGAYIGDRSFVASEKITSHLKEADFNLGELVGIPLYNEFVETALSNKASDYLKANPEVNGEKNTYALSQFACLDEITTNTMVKEYLAYAILRDRVKWGITGESELLKKFRALVTNEAYLNPINSKVAAWEKLSPGQVAPDFTGQTVEGKSVSLSDLRGKYVYVDVWATWCGPCCAEIPYLQELEKEYHGKNIVFLSVSVDDDMDKWKKKVEKDKLGGIQINVGHRTNISKDYMINGIPRFMLFDPEGKIVSVNAPRPSGKIREVLNGLKNL
ncbi:TlpA family protein disulfide reductase [Ancylomarina euxinus]|uniref:TlpA family protein disulfide reductase n=1 Tax=Ancylomarina euxinus TaxID=2283627 RepID=A0A425XZ76_9BACT|nr:TlpA disulfide reductase family protein [Ancylomarina euxinus]MCZ4695569.1 TlpA disulfide reductase family protein [Ancylomarina euxinus]MUP15950.1 redoxin domain-containing protein [Ancylomarina euxinus]RRG20391.1 TlpA family protein disulfide reductase [Ancylomarina euxinus]